MTNETREESKKETKKVVEWVYDKEGFLVKREIELASMTSDTK